GLKARRPHAGLLRRERRALLKARADALSELGGLLVEMYRRGSFRDDLLAERAAGIVGIDGRLAEIETLLHTGRRVPRCECGAAREPDQRYCLECGLALPRVQGRLPSLRRRWIRRVGWYPGDWIWVSLLTLVVAAAGAASAIILTQRVNDRGSVFVDTHTVPV